MQHFIPFRRPCGFLDFSFANRLHRQGFNCREGQRWGFFCLTRRWTMVGRASRGRRGRCRLSRQLGHFFKRFRGQQGHPGFLPRFQRLIKEAISVYSTQGAAFRFRHVIVSRSRRVRVTSFGHGTFSSPFDPFGPPVPIDTLNFEAGVCHLKKKKKSVPVRVV